MLGVAVVLAGIALGLAGERGKRDFKIVYQAI